MTGQREFPFFVNGQYWKKICVSEDSIRQGRTPYHVTTKLDYHILPEDAMPSIMATMKNVVFQLVECAQLYNSMIAHWNQGFWLCDDNVYLEDGNLYLKPKDE